MTPPKSIMGSLANSRFFRSDWFRRITLTILILVFCGFTYFPERYRAVVTLTPTDPATLGLSGALGELGALNSVFGNQAAIEVGLKVARGNDVRRIVIKNLDLQKKKQFTSAVATDRWLEKKINVRSLRGGLLEIELKDRDPDFALAIASEYTSATRERLAQITRVQTAYKREILERLLADATERFALAQAEYDSFRLSNRFPEPDFGLAVISARIEATRTTIKEKETQLAVAREFGTDESIEVKQILAEIRTAKSQLAEALAQNPAQSESLGLVVKQTTDLKVLDQELAVARNLYESYKRYLEGTAVEDLTSTANLRILEPAHIDSARQYNYIPMAIAIFLALLAIATEFYKARHPVGGFRKSSNDD